MTCDEHQTIGIYPADHKEEPFTLMAILGPSGFLELTIVGEMPRPCSACGWEKKWS